MARPHTPLVRGGSDTASLYCDKCGVWSWIRLTVTDLDGQRVSVCAACEQAIYEAKKSARADVEKDAA